MRAKYGNQALTVNHPRGGKLKITAYGIHISVIPMWNRSSNPNRDSVQNGAAGLYLSFPA